MKTVTIETIHDCKDGDEVTISAVLAYVSVRDTKSAGQMAIARIDATGGPVEAVFFPEAYQEAAPVIKTGEPVTINGVIDDPRPGNTLKLKVSRASRAS